MARKASTPTKRRAKTATMKTKEFRARSEVYFGGHGWQQFLARAISVNYSTVKRWAQANQENGLEVPTYIVAIYEFLDRTPRDAWPRRWIREGRKNGRE